MTVYLRRALVVLTAAVLGVWLIGSRVPQRIDALPEPSEPQTTTQTHQDPHHQRPKSESRPSRRDDLLGVQLSAHHDSRPGPALAVMDRLVESGASWLRVDVGWSTLQSEGPDSFDQWYVDLVDAVLAGAHERGLKVIFDLWQTPSWASTSGSYYAPPSDPADFAAALGWAAERWGEEVDAWEVWNEPNYDSFFEGADAAVYTQLLCTAYPAVKEHDDSPVLMGGLMYNDDAWLEATYEAGSKDCFDALATHPYVGPSNAPPDTPSVGAVWRLTHTPAMRTVMDEWGDEDKQIWITELGWSSGQNSEGNPWDFPVSPQKQARYLEEAVALIRDRYPYVGPIIWYRDVDGAADTYQNGFGLMRPDLTPKPALKAFTEAVRGR